MTEPGLSDEVGKQLRNLANILDNPEQRILPLLYGTTAEAKEKRKKAQQELVAIAKTLFGEIENVAKQHHQVTAKLKGKSGDEATSSATLSGLDELYAPLGDEIDAEMLWGQVELQNQAVLKLTKKQINRFRKDPEKVVILDMSQIPSSDDESDSDNDDDSDQSEGGGDKEMKTRDNADSDESAGSDDENEEDPDEDEETRRIRERMESAMDDMDSDIDDEDNESESNEADSKPKATKPEEPQYDPVVEEMKDGFFDLNEMEDFADEEEDYLPDEAYGTPEDSKKKDKAQKKEKSFHQKQRDGDLLQASDDDDDDDDDDDSDFEELYEETEPVKRKKYREDDEIDALYTLYGTPKSEDDDDDDIINMTAADYFGKPNKKLIQRYKEKSKKVPDGDDDSWGEYDFEKEDQDGWRNEDENASQDENQSDEEDSSSDADEEDIPNDDNEETVDKEKAHKKEDKSRHGKQAEKLRLQTEELEKELLAEKPWRMTGETKSTSRPKNSLLESTPEFEMASKQAPTITVEHTANLEEVIKKRILAEDWDDVVPRELPDVGWHKKRGELPEVSQEKSKLGLGELYEREFLKKAVGYDVDAEEKKTAEEKAQDEMKALFANLCSKLDALSNYHFAPRPIADEAEVRPVTAPAIAMEEVLPLHVSDSRGVAPEEVYATKRGRDGVLKGDSEMDQVGDLIVCGYNYLVAAQLMFVSRCPRRMNERDCVHPRRQFGEKPERRSSPTKNLFRDWSLGWASTIPTKNGRCEKSWHWQGHGAKSPMEKRIWTPSFNPVAHFSNDFKPRRSNRSKNNRRALLKAKRRVRTRNQVLSNYKNFYFSRRIIGSMTWKINCIYGGGNSQTHRRGFVSNSSA
jgi:U3 small nucleolar RNA-associated protein MPP10